MGRFFTRFSDLLTPSERERLAELKKNGIPQYIRDQVNNHADEYWKNFELANYIAAHICVGEPPERQEAVTALLEINQKKSRRKKATLRVVVILFWCGILYAIVKVIFR
jgi:hypothetical protein